MWHLLNMRILLVEDEKKIAGFVKRGLQEEGFAVDWAQSGDSAELLITENPYDLVILDIMLPDRNGIDLAKLFRQENFKAPILMLTALSSTSDKVRGLNAGADDYLVKPFEFEELLARIRALLRRASDDGKQAAVLVFSDLKMDLVDRKVTRNDQSVELTQKEFALLECFMRHPNRPLSRTFISEHIWDLHFDNASNVIDVFINKLRKKLESVQPVRLIHTMVGVGYVLKEKE